MYIGIDIGGTNIKGVLTDKNGKILSSGNTPTPDSTKKIDQGIVGLIRILSSEAKTEMSEIEAIGIGAAGSIDRMRGITVMSPNVLCWKNYHLTESIEKLTGIKTFLENDATVACAGFWWENEGKKFTNFVMITLGTGIGGGAVIDGRLYSGQNGSSIEIGHTTVDVNGKECPCGNKGCLERYASATALVEYTMTNLKKHKNSSLHKRIINEQLTSKIIYEEALKEDRLAIESFEYISFYLAAGIVNIINLFNPEAIVFGGGLSKAGKIIIPLVKKTVSERAMKGMKEGIKFFTVKNQSTIPALGAAKIAMDRLKHIL